MINWEEFREKIKLEALLFLDIDESDRTWFDAGEIIEGAVIYDSWDDNIKEVAEWLVINGLGAQPTMAQFILDKNSK